MIVIDEYLAIRVVSGRTIPEMPDDELGLPTSAHWRLLQALHRPRGGQLTQALSLLSESDMDTLRWPHPEVLSVLDPRPLLDDAARLAALYGGGWHAAEVLAAGIANRADLWFARPDNVGRPITNGAAELRLAVHVATP